MQQATSIAQRRLEGQLGRVPLVIFRVGVLQGDGLTSWRVLGGEVREGCAQEASASLSLRVAGEGNGCALLSRTVAPEVTCFR